MVKKHMMKRIYYSEEFEREMDMFEKNIMIDPRFDEKIQHDKQRFSHVIRSLIETYNRKFKTDYLAKKMEEVKQEEVAHE